MVVIEPKDMSAKYEIAFSAEEKPSGKIMNGNGTELQQARFTHIEHRRCD